MTGQNAPSQRFLFGDIPQISIWGMQDSSRLSIGGLANLNTDIASAIAVISNDSDQPITALSAVWTIQKSDGTTKILRHRCDVFLAGTSKRFIAPSRTKIIFGPNTCLSTELLSHDQSGFVSLLEKETAVHLRGSKAVTVRLDALMFADGAMYAEDDKYARDIEARVTAAKKFADHVAVRTGAGASRTDAFSSASTIVPNSSLERAWISTYAADVKRQPANRSRQYIERLSNIQLPNITVHRIQIAER